MSKLYRESMPRSNPGRNKALAYASALCHPSATNKISALHISRISINAIPPQLLWKDVKHVAYSGTLGRAAATYRA